MKLKLSLIFCFILLTAAVSGSNWIPLNNAPEGTLPEVQVLKSDEAGTILELEFAGFYVDEIQQSGETYQLIRMPGCLNGLEVGAPDLPRYLTKVGISDRKGVIVKEIHRETVTLEGYRPFPVQVPLKDNGKPGEFVINEAMYASSKVFPAQGSAGSTPAVWREIRLTEVTINPVMVNFKSSSLEVAQKVTVEISNTRETGLNAKTTMHRPISPDYRKMYQDAIVNYSSLKFDVKDEKEESVKYLIIADDSLVSSIMPLAEWYIQTGIYTQVMPTSESGSTNESIKAVIQNYYTTEGTEYVLLVGEITQIPVWSFNHSGDAGVGDYDYVCLEGDDWYPELAIGRIITTQPDVVSHVVARTLNYIQSPPTDGWLEKSMLCAHEEQYPGKYTQCKNEIKEFDYAIQTPIFDTYYPPEGQTQAQVIAAMEEGRGLVNYRGHGDTQEWSWSIGWGNSNIYALNNGPYTPVVWNIACNNGEVDSSSECLSEAWQNAGASGEGGAVASIGATRPSYTVENHDFDKSLYWAMFNDGITRIGDVVNAGKETTVGMSTNGEFNARIYILFGDPAMDITTMTPGNLVVDHLPTVPMGSSDFSVNVTDGRAPVENALVCIYKDGDTYESTYTDNLGNAVLPALLTSGGTMQLTITCHNFQPYTAELLVEAVGCGAILLDNSMYNCDQDIMIRVWDSDLNTNPGAIDTAQIDISSDSESTPELVVLDEIAPDSGEFRGTIHTSSTESGEGYLLLNHDDAITAVYHDADCDGSPRDVQDTAVADCVGPIITNVTVADIGTDFVVIQWATDEMSNSVLTWGDSMPPTTETASSRFETEHEIVLEDLDICTQYWFKVASVDAGGNVAEDDNGGLYYTFTTLQLLVLLESNMDIDPGWTYEGLWAWGQPQGVEGDPSTGYTGDNVVGFNLSGSYTDSLPATYVTSTTFDCSSAGQAYLSFWKWLGIENSSYDHATVEVSNDGGSTWNEVWAHAEDTVTPSSWTFVEYDISEWAAGNSDVMVRWSLGPTDTSVNYCGWNIDDVMVSYTTACNVPILSYESHTIDDSTGNNDGEINAGETISSYITLQNLGTAATGVSATLTTTNPHVTITQGSSTYPDIAQSGSAMSNSSFEFVVSPEAENDEVIAFNISWTATENSGNSSFSEMVVAPTLMIQSFQITEGAGSDNDGIFDPGETVQIMINVMNSGSGTATDVMGTLTSDFPAYITFDDDSAEFPDIAPEASQMSITPHFTVTASASIPDHSLVTFTLTLEAQGYMTEDTFSIDITASTFAQRYSWSMDSDPGWTTEGQWEWGIPQGQGGDPSSGYTGDSVIGYNLAGQYANNLPEIYLTSGPINCANIQAVEVRFMRWLGVESSSYDHASFQVSNDTTNWTTLWTHSGASFTDPDWQPMTYDISAVADLHETVYLRWVMGTTDVSVTYCGWNIDDVEIWGETYGPQPTSTPVTPTETPTPVLTNTPTPTDTPSTPTATPTPFICYNNGDVNNDGDHSPEDALMAFQIYMEIMGDPTEDEMCRADCGGDGTITPQDALCVFMDYLSSSCSCADPMPVMKRGIGNRLSESQNNHEVIAGSLLAQINAPRRSGEAQIQIRVEDHVNEIDAFGFRVALPEGVYYEGTDFNGLVSEWEITGANLSENVVTVGGFDPIYPVQTENSGTLAVLNIQFDNPESLQDIQIFDLKDDLKSYTVTWLD